MKKSRFEEEKIISVLKQAEAGMKVTELVRKPRRLKELESENARLKKMYAELPLTHHALQDAVEKKL